MRSGCRPERGAAVDHVALGVLVGLPGNRPLLVYARLAEVADARREEGLKLGPLRIGELDGYRDRPDILLVVRPLERLQLALVRVGRDRVTGDHPRRAIYRNHRV